MFASALITLLCPLAGALLLALCGRLLPRRLGELAACAAVAGSLTGAVWTLWRLNGLAEPRVVVHLAEWFSAGGFSAAAQVLLDPLSGLMAAMVALVAFIIHVYSVAFMRRDRDWARYFCYLNLFVFFMQVIVLADDLVFLFLGWEGVGFCSFALIGFWHTDPQRVLAGRKAFLVTRVGDVAFLAALAVLWGNLGNLDISGLPQHAAELAPGAVTLLGLLFLWAAAGKSAQLPLLVWLPDAMAGPSPVSALIHAATMVTAGIYLLMRLFPLVSLSPAALAAMALVGALTAFAASCTALAQRDIKRVLAWSTISQVGYMLLAIGAGDPAGGFFHLLVHAAFKSLLFMTAGIVIQASAEEHDLFRMGRGTRQAAPGVVWALGCGGVALAGLPPFAGFFSKGRILESALAHGQVFWTMLWTLGAVAALLTSIYTFRMLLLAFTGTPALPPRGKAEPVPRSMLHVLWPLALAALAGGFLNLPDSFAAALHLPAGWAGWLDGFVATVPGMGPASTDGAEATAALVDGGLAVLGLVVAVMLYGPQRERRVPAEPGSAGALLVGGLGLDALYRQCIVRPYVALADVLWRQADDGGVDAAAMGAGRLALALGRRTGRWASGRLSGYVLMLLLGLALTVLALAAMELR